MTFPANPISRNVRDLRPGDVIIHEGTLQGRVVDRVEADGGDHYTIVWMTRHPDTILPGDLRLLVAPLDD